jgi:uncharacterized protein YpmB
MKRLSFITCSLLLIFIIGGCSKHINPEEEIKGPGLTKDVAIEVAKNNYYVNEIETVELRSLTSEEFNKIISEEARKFTPVYYVVEGKDINKKEITVFVNSNDINFSFKSHK